VPEKNFNQWGGFGPGTVNLFRVRMEMEPLTFSNVNLTQINQQMPQESRFNTYLKPNKKGKQTSISDVV